MNTSRWMIVAMVMGTVWGSAVQAGDLTPPGPPGPTMHTLEEIYQRLTNTQAEVEETKQRVADLAQQLADNGITQVPDGMVLIPAGDFVMGDTFAEGDPDELPLHGVTLSAFYMDKYEVTSNLWGMVYTWAVANGYAFDNAGTAKRVDHLIHTVDWHDSLAWANARSQRDGLTPCYTNANGTYYTNSTAGFLGGCDWSADGYRLPTEAEWEYAARGGAANRRFPWEDANTIEHARANYKAVTNSYTYDTSATEDYHPDYDSDGFPYTSPVGSFAPNGYGLYDMAGNLYEWCWDWYGSTYYASSPRVDPRGPGSGWYRLCRGGTWYNEANTCRVANRLYASPTYKSNLGVGLRLVRAAQ